MNQIKRKIFVAIVVGLFFCFNTEARTPPKKRPVKKPQVQRYVAPTQAKPVQQEVKPQAARINRGGNNNAKLGFAAGYYTPVGMIGAIAEYFIFTFDGITVGGGGGYPGREIMAGYKRYFKVLDNYWSIWPSLSLSFKQNYNRYEDGNKIFVNNSRLTWFNLLLGWNYITKNWIDLSIGAGGSMILSENEDAQNLTYSDDPTTQSFLECDEICSNYHDEQGKIFPSVMVQVGYHFQW